MCRTILGGPVVPDVKNVRAGDVGVRLSGTLKNTSSGMLPSAAWKSITFSGGDDAGTLWPWLFAVWI